MRIAVVGGTGMLGTPLVGELVRRGHGVAVLSRTSPAGGLPAGAEHRRVDLRDEEGLETALSGCDALVDAANSRRQARAVLVEGTRRLSAAGARAGIRHHLLISIVGCDQVPIGYYRRKVEQEQALAAGQAPWSLLRATQFHPLLDGWFASAARLRLRPAGAALLQPIDVNVVAGRLADGLEEGPQGRLPDLAGPQIRPLGELTGAWARARDRRLVPLRLPSVGRAAQALRDGGLCDETAATPGPSFEEWLTRG